ncbi:MAG: NUDIX hydrolase [Flavobacteriales bacterium]|nr:NUDIX hydrolase [Flavobacteriales bacterium]
MSKINISIDCVVFGFDSDLSLKVLLITKKEDPNASSKKSKTQTALPGDLIKPDEELDPAAKRILKSLTSIDEIYLKQFAIFSDPNRVKQAKDQLWLRSFRKNPEERVVTVGYISLVNIQDFKPQASYFADDVIWTSINEIPDLTFDHNQIVDAAMEFMKKELNHKMSSILLPKNFTLPQLQKLYEDVLDKKIDKRNFRKQILREGVIVKTTNINKTGRKGKPAAFYQFHEENE